jgi:hypothetical protein
LGKALKLYRLYIIIIIIIMQLIYFIFKEGGISVYRVSADFMSVHQDFIPAVIPSQKCYMDTGLISSGYGAT